MDLDQLQTLLIPLVWPIGAVYVFSAIGQFLWKGYRIRAMLRNMPGPPEHSWLFGHLKALGEMMEELPYNGGANLFPLLMKQKYSLRQNFVCVDAWPFSDPLILVMDPDIEQQITVEQDTPKHPLMGDILSKMAGTGEMVGSNGPHWKKWRTTLNPGFSANHMMKHVPMIVDETGHFVNTLANFAKSGKVFRLEEEATCLTLDIIGLVVADLRLDTQGRGRNGAFAKAMRHQTTIIPVRSTDVWKKYNPILAYQRWRNLRILRNFVGKKVDEQMRTPPNFKKWDRRGGTVIELAQRSGNEKDNFREMAITHTLSFIFGGEDSTASTICYALYELARDPECLARIRAEHDSILGSTEQAANTIKNDPYVLNRLPYTMMVINETLRLWPPVGSARQGSRDLFIRDPATGERYPTEGCLISLAHTSLMRNPAVWGEDAARFDPSRFEDESKLPPHAFRPFEKGPRRCIGQELALIELRIVLALVVRSFDFTAAFDRLDELKNDGSLWSEDKNWRKGKQDIQGEMAYQVHLVTLKPREGMPMVVRARETI